MTHESVRRAKLAEMLAGTFARAAEEVADAFELVGVAASRDDVRDALDSMAASLAEDRRFLEDDTVDPDAALDAARDAAAGVL